MHNKLCIDNINDIYIHAQPEDTTNKDVKHLDNKTNSITSDKSKQNESISLQIVKSLNLKKQNSFKRLDTSSNNISTKHGSRKSIIKSNINSSRRKCKKSNEIVFIDLTSDIVLETCIKKRNSRKLPWLEEAKKRACAKIIKASRKRMKKKQDVAVDTHQSNTSKNINHHLEAAAQSECGKDGVKEKYDSSTFWSAVTKDNDNKMEITEEVVACSEGVRISIGAEVNSKEINIKAPTVISKPVLTEILPPEKQASNTLDSAVNDDCSRNGDISNIRTDGKENNRFNKSTVIKRLTETDTISEPETRERVESFVKVCDLEIEYATVNNCTTFTQYEPRDNAVNTKRSNVNAANSEAAEYVTSSKIDANLERRDNENVSGDVTLSNVCVGETFYRPDCCVNVTDTDGNYQKVIAAQGYDKSEAMLMVVAGTVEGSSVRDTLDQGRGLQSSHEFVQNTITQWNLESQVESKSLESRNAEQNDFYVRAKLRISNNQEVHENLRTVDQGVVNTRESIFESYSTDMKNISDTVSAPRPNEYVEDDEHSCMDENPRKPMVHVIDDKCDNFGKYSNKENVPRECNEVSLKTMPKEERNNLYNTSEERNPCSNGETKFIVQDSELQDNIDGLSLLASVSQHVPHLKPHSEAKFDQIKVKDYASLRYTCYNQITDDEADTNDSSNTVSQLLENPSTEIINRIVGVYPEDDLDKVALGGEATSCDPECGNRDNELCNVGSHPEASINYDVDTLSHNLIPVESNAHSAKENTNVILNGETVVLLQKSPNSNLYIINKAVENSKDHNSDEEMIRLKEKNWIATTEECGQFGVVPSLDHTSYNMELASYSKELPYLEGKCSVVRGKGIKVEPEASNFADAKAYTKKLSLSGEMLPVNPQIYQDANVISKSIEKRKSPKSSLAYRQNIKQEFNNIPNHIASNCAIPGCNGIHTLPHEVDPQHPLHIPAAHPTNLPSIYGNCGGNADLCVPYHKHCTSVSCSLQINGGTPLRSHAKASSPCGRSHCSCLNCTYDIMAHCRQCIHPPTDTHVSCIESSPYFMPTHSSVQSPAVQEHERTKSDAVMGKLYDDQLLCKVEKSLLQTNSLGKLDVECDSEKMYNKDAENKLPLKKRLKAHALAYREIPLKAEKVGNYPAVPMMSIAALEVMDNTQKRFGQSVKSEYELSPAKKNESVESYHCASSLVRRDYYKDAHAAGTHQNITKESARNQSSNTVYQEACLQRTVKSAAERKQIIMSSETPCKLLEMEPIQEEGTYKKTKKTQSPAIQTRSSKRNVPKVNYSYTEVDPEWNPSGESKRKRRKTSR